MSVTTFLVTRNHEESLGRAIQSVAGLSGEVIVADTGSTDRTISLAREFGAKLVSIDWANDFAAACKQAVAAAAEEWLFWLNPDEELEPEGLPAISAAMANSSSFAWQIRIRQQLRPDDPGSGTLGWQPRLFRRDSLLQFQGRLHPEFHPPLEEIAAIRGFSIGSVEAIIRRHAYLSKATPDKMRWVVQLLEAELQDRPGQLGYMIELGRNLLWLNDPHGHAVLAEASEQVRRLAHLPVAPTPWVGSLIEYLLSIPGRQSGGTLSREEIRSLASRWFPDTPPVIWAVASDWFAAGNYSAAAALLERLIGLGQTGSYDGANGFAPDIVGPSAILNLGICWLNLQRWKESQACFLQVMNDPSRREAALRGYEIAESKQRGQRGSMPFERNPQ